ncbi:MAG TPA: twin transmembrane helix small protein [Gammaproteobacteria bacterium]|nr:twin transmembrane helix small protein [Gammaproteobacteria bacterium]
MFKLLVMLFLASVLFSLGSGLYYMMKDKGKGDRAVKALTWRISISIFLFVLLLIGAQFGLVEPHGVTP